MKPIKNRPYCIGANRSKMLFASERKANNFIRFNAEEIELETGRAPVRSYYCPFCCGWHVTSLKSEEIGRMLSERDEKMLQILLSKQQKKSGNVSKPAVVAQISADDVARNFLEAFRNFRIGETMDELTGAELETLVKRYDQIIGSRTGNITDVELRNKLIRYANRARDICALRVADLIYKEVAQDGEPRSWLRLYLSVVTCVSKEVMLTLNQEIREIRLDLNRLQSKLYLPTWKKINIAFGSVERVRNERKKHVGSFAKIDSSSVHYKRILISLIDSLAEVQKSYDEGDLPRVWKLVEKGMNQLEMLVEDAAVQKVRSFYANWFNMLRAA